MTDYIAYVNIKQGTSSEFRFSCGNTLLIRLGTSFVSQELAKENVRSEVVA